MALEIVNWNLGENIDWWCALSISGGNMLAILYASEADAQAGENGVYGGSTAGLGSGLPLVLRELGGTAAAPYHQSEYDWHLLVSGQSGDPERLLRVRAFVDLEPISHSVYRNQQLIAARATAEIDAHTHARLLTRLPLAIHLPTLEVGDIVRLSSARRGVTRLHQVVAHTIVAARAADGGASLTSELELAHHVELTR